MPDVSDWMGCDLRCPGWCHMNDPHEVQKCDECDKFADDHEARLAHRQECGCAWGLEDDGTCPHYTYGSGRVCEMCTEGED